MTSPGPNGLPEAFIRQVDTWPLDPADKAAFWASFTQPRIPGLRPNRRRFPDAAAESMLHALSRRLGHATDWLTPEARIPWAPGAVRFPEALRPGTDPTHLAGFFYLQEPSAMLPAEVLRAQPGERVLDLCAAPGGKTTQIADHLAGDGLLIANDISPKRAQVLRRNCEQMGAGNVQVTCEDPVRLAEAWPGTFDAILLDAPCSGEGMFRRDPKAPEAWAAYGPASVIPVQTALLEAAAKLLRPGGRIVYSTCTFNPEENECRIAGFLERHPTFRVRRPAHIPTHGIRGGLPRDGLPFDPAGVLRIWPQDGAGEGHFCALLVDTRAPEPEALPATDADWTELFAAGPTQPPNRRPSKRAKGPATPDPEADRAAFVDFLDRYLTPEGRAAVACPFRYALHTGDHLHALPTLPPTAQGLSYLRFGTHVATFRGRPPRRTPVPAHSLLVSLPGPVWRHRLDWPSDDPRLARLIRGETLAPTPADRAVIVAAQATLGPGPYLPLLAEGQPIAWLKVQGPHLKNLFPSGWTR